MRRHLGFNNVLKFALRADPLGREPFIQEKRDE